jgi:hypothetical protein
MSAMKMAPREINPIEVSPSSQSRNAFSRIEAC